jgi:ATP-dependent DNA helicase RecG
VCLSQLFLPHKIGIYKLFDPIHRSVVFLQEIKSELLEESAQIFFNDLCRQLLIAKGSDEDLRPVNSGLLFFSNHPENYFNRVWIEVVIRKDEAGDDFSEKHFKDPIHHQLRNALNFIKNQIIVEKVKKISGQAEAVRFYNFPFEAVEEALGNAVYHESYEMDKPIEVQIWPDKIEILSFPGPVPPVDAKILATQQQIVARDYRNRRIGDFLKELHLTEGRGTGVPKIYRVLERNGSPKPILETNTDCNYFLTVILAHTDVKSDLIGNEINEPIMPRRSKEILGNVLSISDQTKNKQRYLDPLLKQEWIELTIKENPNDRNQKYQLTEKGRLLVKILKI